MWSSGAALPSQISRISMKFQIVVLRHVTLTMGILRHFLPWWRKKTNFPEPAIPWFKRSLTARMQFFCCGPEVTCPRDSYVTAGCKSLLNILGLIIFFLLQSDSCYHKSILICKYGERSPEIELKNLFGKPTYNFLYLIGSLLEDIDPWSHRSWREPVQGSEMRN